MNIFLPETILKAGQVMYPSTWYWSGGGIGPSYAPDSFYAKTVSVAADRYTLLSPLVMQLDIGGYSYTLNSQVALDLSLAATWDTTTGTDYRTASNRKGKDFYVYACQNTINTPLFIVSANASYPSGTNPNTAIAYSASNTRKVGGFHCLCADMSTPGSWAANTAYALGATILNGNNWYRVSVAGTSAASAPSFNTAIDASTIDGTATWMCEAIHPASGYLAGDIIPNSVWDLKHYAVSGNVGMAYIDRLDEWHDIYIATGSYETTISLYGMGGTNNTTWNETVDNAASVKKYLLRDYSSQVSAEGSNQQTNISTSAWAPTGGNIDVTGRRMISNYFLEDCCGLFWLWLDEQSYQYVSGNTTGTFGFVASVTENKGQIVIQGATADVKLLAGGHWTDGASCGSRSRHAGSYRWGVASSNAARLAARAIHK